MRFRKALGLGLGVFAVWALGGCAAYEQNDSETTGTTSQAATGGPAGDNPLTDVSPFSPNFSVTSSIYGGPYGDLAASDSEFFMLNKTNGNVEIRAAAWPSSWTATIPWNFNGIDYVTDGGNTWGLLASLSWGGSYWIAINMGRDGNPELWLSVPSSFGAVYDLTGVDEGNNTLGIYFVVPQYPVYSKIVKATYSRSTGTVNWNTGYSCTLGYYSSSHITAANGYIYTYMNYYTSAFARTPTSSCSWTYENISPYTEHAYYWAGDYDRFAPDGMDIQSNSIVGIDYYVNRYDPNNNRQQVLTSLPLSSLRFY
jgi:hypothetical protein